MLTIHFEVYKMKTVEEVKKFLDDYEALLSRSEYIIRNFCGHKWQDTIDFTAETIEYFNDKIEVSGRDRYDRAFFSFPIRYLTMTDDELEAELEEKKLQEQLAKEELKRKRAEQRKIAATEKAKQKEIKERAELARLKAKYEGA